jgi:hypothetical protein
MNLKLTKTGGLWADVFHKRKMPVSRAFCALQKNRTDGSAEHSGSRAGACLESITTGRADIAPIVVMGSRAKARAPE